MLYQCVCVCQICDVMVLYCLVVYCPYVYKKYLYTYIDTYILCIVDIWYMYLYTTYYTIYTWVYWTPYRWETFKSEVGFSFSKKLLRLHPNVSRERKFLQEVAPELVESMATRDRSLQVGQRTLLGCPDDFVCKRVWPLPSYCLVCTTVSTNTKPAISNIFSGIILACVFSDTLESLPSFVESRFLQSHTDTWGKTLDFSRLELCKTNSGSQWDHLRRTGQYPWKYSGGPRSLVLAIWTESAAWLVVDKGFSVKVFVPSTLPSNGCTIPRRKKPAQVATMGAILCNFWFLGWKKSWFSLLLQIPDSCCCWDRGIDSIHTYSFEQSLMKWLHQYSVEPAHQWVKGNLSVCCAAWNTNQNAILASKSCSHSVVQIFVYIFLPMCGYWYTKSPPQLFQRKGTAPAGLAPCVVSRLMRWRLLQQPFCRLQNAPFCLLIFCYISYVPSICTVCSRTNLILHQKAWHAGM